MTADEHREGAKTLARHARENPGYKISHDNDATELIALAVETKDPHLLEIVENHTEQWLESTDNKGARQYLIEALKPLLEQAK